MSRQVPTLTGIVQAVSSVSANSVVMRDGNSDASFARPTASIAHKGGGLQLAYATKTGAYTATESDFLLQCDASTAAFTVTLPAAASFLGQILVIINVGATGTVTIDGSAAETINGAATVDLTTQYATRMIMSNGSNWIVLAS